MKTNSLVYPFRVGETKHFVLSAAGMFALAEAVKATDPELASQLRNEAFIKHGEALHRFHMQFDGEPKE